VLGAIVWGSMQTCWSTHFVFITALWKLGSFRMELMSSRVLQRQNCRATSFLWRFPSSLILTLQELPRCFVFCCCYPNLQSFAPALTFRNRQGIHQACSTFHVMHATSAKYGLHAGKHEIQYAERRMNKYTYIYMHNVTCVFFYTS
jgi:hypothetical protein